MPLKSLVSNLLLFCYVNMNFINIYLTNSFLMFLKLSYRRKAQEVIFRYFITYDPIV